MKLTKAELKEAAKTEAMQTLADDTRLTNDRDERLFEDDGRLNVFAHLMTAKEYAAMERDLAKFSINRRHYSVSAWNDSSGFEYWKNGGERGDSNYIQVTVYVKVNPSLIDRKQLRKDVDAVSAHFAKYDNLDQYHATPRENAG